MANEQKITSLPRRVFLPMDIRAECDSLGFLAAETGSLYVEDLFAMQAVLMVAPPWLGKSFVAQQLSSHFRMNQQKKAADAPFGRFFHLTAFERYGGEQALLPLWWNDWRETETEACWICDALDEDAKKGCEGAHRIVDEIQRLTPLQRSHLHLFLFARESEMPERIRERLIEIYGDTRGDTGMGLHCFRLAPLDAGSAKDFIGTEAFIRVCRLIRENALKSIAGYPSVLTCLKRYPEGKRVTDVEVWHDVLVDLLRDKRVDNPLDSAQPPIDDQFRAAAMLAAAVTFGDHDELDDGRGESTHPGIERLVRTDHAAGRNIATAARYVVRSSIFRRTAYGYAFGQHHVQEWLAAFALSDFSLTRLRPLVTEADGQVAAQHRGVLGLLVRTSTQPAVQNWIKLQFGGVAPRSDAAPWTLGEALAALDELQRLARTTSSGLALWRDRGLSDLHAPGLGTRLAERIADSGLSLPERELLIDVACATGETQAVPAAIGVLKDGKADGGLRRSAVMLVLAAGTAEQKTDLGEYAKTLSAGSQVEQRIKGDIISWLYKNKLWDYDTAAFHAPPADRDVSLLHHYLEDDMQLDNARELLRHLDLERFFRELGQFEGKRRPARAGELVLKAIEMVANQEEPTLEDFELLLPIALSSDRPEWRGIRRPMVHRVFAKSATARRRLLGAVVNEGQLDESTSWRWVSVLDVEDVDWMLQLAESRGTEYRWLWTQLLRMSDYAAIPAQRRHQIRARVGEVDGKLVTSYDEQRHQHEEKMKEYDEEEKRLAEQQKVETYSLAELVQDTLSSEKAPLGDRMYRLGWIALSEGQFRPTNVSGTWDELPLPLRESVLDVCHQALVQCEPTVIPDGNSYSGAIVYEAVVFRRMLAEQRAGYQLDADQIRKWLPACLIFPQADDEGMLECCRTTDLEATEDVIVAEAARQLRSEGGQPHFLKQLPVPFWTPRLSKLIADLVENTSLQLTGRITLLEALVAKAVEYARPILNSWLCPDKPPTDLAQEQRTAAIDLLLGIAPTVAWPEVRKDVVSRGKSAFLKLHAFRDIAGEVRGGIGHWPAAMLEELADLLNELFPFAEEDPVTEPDDVSWGSGSDWRYRNLRGQIPYLLMSRNGPEDTAALERLADRYDYLKQWYIRMKAESAAREVLSRIAPSDLTLRPGSLPVDKVARLLDDGLYRLIRNAGDLQAVVLEEIEAIRSDAKEHLSMLYEPRKSQSKKRAAGQKSLQEDALQAYLCCRLKDRLRRVLDEGSCVFINREALAAKDQRLDLKVEAPTVTGEAATVVVEVKWSSNPGVSTSLVTQLGLEYLVHAKLTHGIYLVGWNQPGRWSGEAGNAPADRGSIRDWLAALSAQARQFSQLHPEVSIQAVIMDLIWPSSRSSKSPSSRRTKGVKEGNRQKPLSE